MNSNHRLIIIILSVSIIAVGCSRSKATLNGMLTASGENVTVSNRQIALCQITGDVSNLPTDCILMDMSTTSNEQGEFQISGISQGKYFVLYDTSLSDFKSGLDKWKGKTLKLSDVAWVSSDYCEYATNDDVTIHLVSGMSLSTDALIVAARDLFVCNSPFVLALDPAKDKNAPLVVDVKGATTEVEIQVYNFQKNK